MTSVFTVYHKEVLLWFVLKLIVFPHSEVIIKNILTSQRLSLSRPVSGPHVHHGAQYDAVTSARIHTGLRAEGEGAQRCQLPHGRHGRSGGDAGSA